MWTSHRLSQNIFTSGKILLTVLLIAGCSKSFNTSNYTPPTSSSSQDGSIWTQGTPGPISASEGYSSQPMPSGSYCGLFIPVETFNRNQEFRIVVISKDMVRVEVSVNNSSYGPLGTQYGELRWPGNTFDPGQYNLVFRGISTSGKIISCDPTTKLVTILPEVNSPAPAPNPPSSPTPGGGSFTSLHQFPITYVKSSYLDSSGNLIHEKTPELRGFKDQFSPSGTPGCAMGYPELRSLCQTVSGGFGFILSGYTSYSEFKVYIPASTTFFSLSGFQPQGVDYAVVSRLGSPPVRTAPLTSAEYQAVKSSQNVNTAFNSLIAGQEMTFVHDGGGNLSLSGTARLSNSPVQEGKWLYIRVINGNSIYNLNGVYEVKLDQYRPIYNSITFETNGDPVGGR